MLRNGQWQQDWQPVQKADEQGRFIRLNSQFRGRADAESNRYHLYVALICPWAHRTLIALHLKGLQDVVGISIVEPFLTDKGWQFGDFAGATTEHLHGFTHAHQLYTKADPSYTGRVTVPIMWDKQRHTIVNNESEDIVRILNHDFHALAKHNINLYPETLRPDIDGLNQKLYDGLNNGVYKVGFASTQYAYDEAVAKVFDTLDMLEEHLEATDYLVGNTLTETDIRAYVSLIRFDAAYHGLFKCDLRRVSDYPNVQAYMERLYKIAAFRETTNMTHIKHGYYSIKALNPSGIVPVGPEQIIS